MAAPAPVSYAVDVSSHQGSHQSWRSFGVHMGIAKASEGRHSRDEWFVRHLADIRAAGLVPGAYHFAWPNQDVSLEAANYVAAVRPVNGRDLVHILDLEPYPDGAKNYVGRSDAQIKAWANAWVAAVRKAFPGQRVLAYTPRDAYTRHFPAGTDGYWYPAYPVQGRSFATAGKLDRPSVGGRPVWGWQFTSVPLDRTVIYMSPDALRTWAAGDITPQKEDDVSWDDKLSIGAGPWFDKAESATAKAWLMGANGKAEKAAVNSATVLTEVRALAGKVGTASLTDAQLDQLAAKVAASPVLAAAIAKAVVDLEAKRLDS
jgi:GH25 family lysozyme M1 (1,4-beta-N-acetylmuramidase)